jgi:hypothetical protein
LEELLIEELLSSAKERNYERMRLDTFLKLQAAVIYIIIMDLKISLHIIITRYREWCTWKKCYDPCQ